MREIKFKAYDTERKQWLNSKDLIFHNGFWFRNFRTLEDYTPLDVESGKIKIMEMVGAKDEKGNVVYEGDILKFHHLENYNMEEQVVSMKGYSWCTNEFEFWEIIERGYTFEIVGNINVY